jgi:hypothetical protein
MHPQLYQHGGEADSRAEPRVSGAKTILSFIDQLKRFGA